jgi:drug/metabolite transporter (DMT)-like permease
LTITLWASAFAGIRAGLPSYSPQSVALWRYLTASIVLAADAGVTKMPLPQRRDLPGIALAGFIGLTLYSVTLNAGEQKIPAGSASLIIGSAPSNVAMNCHTIM